MAEAIKEYVSKTNIKVIQLNVLSWNNPARRLWISLYLKDKSPDIILLNSTSLVCTDHNKNSITKIKIENYKTYLNTQGIQLGSAMLVKNNLSHNVIPNSSSSIIAVKVLTASGPVIFFTAYTPA